MTEIFSWDPKTMSSQDEVCLFFSSLYLAFQHTKWVFGRRPISKRKTKQNCNSTLEGRQWENRSFLISVHRSFKTKSYNWPSCSRNQQHVQLLEAKSLLRKQKGKLNTECHGHNPAESGISKMSQESNWRGEEVIFPNVSLNLHQNKFIQKVINIL